FDIASAVLGLRASLCWLAHYIVKSFISNQKFRQIRQKSKRCITIALQLHKKLISIWIVGFRINFCEDIMPSQPNKLLQVKQTKKASGTEVILQCHIVQITSHLAQSHKLTEIVRCKSGSKLF